MIILYHDVIKILLAILIGGLIGAEREFRDKTAGFRTIIFICLGATLFTIFSLKIGGKDDPRIAANIVSGIGFLGAGVILRAGGRIVGLTTAAMIWLTAAVGMGIGSGHYTIAGVTAAIILIIVWLFPRFEEIIDRARETRSYEITCSLKYEKSFELLSMIQSHDLQVKNFKQVKSEDRMVCTFVAVGSPENHDRVRGQLFADTEVRSFNF